MRRDARAALDVVEEEPFNAQARLDALRTPLTPNEAFYVRNHFPIPEPLPEPRLRVTGAVGRPMELEPARWAQEAEERTVTLECAGNGRNQFRPPVPGTPWGDRAVSTARFRGIPLSRILDEAQPAQEAVEVLFVGADRGLVDGREVGYERSLPLAEALGGHVLLAWDMNGAPLPAAHGGPVRLVVAGWYGMASVKWLTEVRVLTEPFRGAFQTDRYVYDAGDGAPVRPVERMKVRALILEPGEDGTVPAGNALAVKGRAWSGSGRVTRVEVSADGGETWHVAEVEKGGGPGAWTSFRVEVPPLPGGRHRLTARATDEAGSVQPLSPSWDRLGYGGNAAGGPTVRVV